MGSDETPGDVLHFPEVPKLELGLANRTDDSLMAEFASGQGADDLLGDRFLLLKIIAGQVIESGEPLLTDALPAAPFTGFADASLDAHAEKQDGSLRISPREGCGTVLEWEVSLS